MRENYTEDEKKRYITSQLGNEYLQKMENIHRGGNNASKGQHYEDQFMLFKVLEVASSDNQWAKHRFTHQNFDFFDDICYEDFITGTKHNYQAKNSSLSAADWNDEHSERAKNQITIDLDFHEVQYSQNYLVVANEKKALENLAKIPSELSEYCSSLFFPYYSDRFIDFVREKLSGMLEKLTQSSDLSDQDFAAKLLSGILTNSDNPRTLKEIFQEAESKGYPNPFINPNYQIKLPEWLKTLLSSNQKIVYRCQGNFLIVTFGELEIKVPLGEMEKLDDNDAIQITDLLTLITYLKLLSAKSLVGGEKNE